MSKLVINGPARIRGELSVRGAKNAALPIIMASVVARKPVILENVPIELKDITAAIEALRYIGCDIAVGEGRLEVFPKKITTTFIPSEICCKFRSSLLFLGLLTGMTGNCKITLPGGCEIGERRFDLHLEGLRKLGAEVGINGDAIEVHAEKLVGADINFYLPTTTGTENLMIAACFAEGRTRIFNANTRPEIADLGSFLNMLGANITVRNRVVEINGKADFSGGKYCIMPGWDEALTYIIAAGITGGEVCIKDFSTEYIKYDIEYLKKAGMEIFETNGNVSASGKNKQLRAFDLFTAPYPGVNSDMQPLFAAFASQCEGESTITDQRFTERFQYVKELQKFGMQIENYGNCAIIRGKTKLKGAQVKAIDLRCGAALILSALAAEGITEISNLYQIERGYEYLVSRLRNLGAKTEIFND